MSAMRRAVHRGLSAREFGACLKTARSPLFQLWSLQTQRMNFLTRVGCRVEFSWDEERLALRCSLIPPAHITSSQFCGIGKTLDVALFGAYQIAMQAGVFDPMEVEG